MSMKVRQVLYENRSDRIRRERDHLFRKLTYHCLLSRYVALSEDQAVANRNEMTKTLSQVLKRRERGKIDAVYWKTSDVKTQADRKCDAWQEIVVL